MVFKITLFDQNLFVARNITYNDQVLCIIPYLGRLHYIST